VAELEYGVKKSSQSQANQTALIDFLIPLTILDFSFEAAVEYGTIRTQLEAKGTPIGSLDMLIAAHAKASNLTLVTNNVKEFSRVEGLKVENWLDRKA
jgi:tRNA(fMet)-specific endonuclease VapC